MRRKLLYISFLVLLLSLAVLLHWYIDADTPAPKVRVGKETTYITEPVDADGYLDYQAALNDRLGKDVTPEKNANTLLWKALGPRPEGGNGMPAEYFKRLGIDEPPKDGKYFLGFSNYLKERLKLKPEEDTALLDQQIWAATRPWTANDYPRVAGWLEANEKPLVLVIEASKRPEYFNPLICKEKNSEAASIIGALIPSVAKCRELANALTGRAMLRVAEGNFDDAWQDLLASHRLARLVARGASLVEDLVGIAIDQMTSQADLAYLERADLSSKQIRERLKDLQALPPFPPLADKIDLLERFTYLEMIQLIRRRGPTILGTLSDGEAKEGLSGDGKDMEKIDWEPVLIDGNQWYDRMAAAMRQKDRAERGKALKQIENDLKVLRNDIPSSNVFSRFFLDDKARGKAIGDIVLSLLMPAVVKVQDAQDRIEQVERNLHVAFALAAYRAEHGRYPAKLNDLAPAYLPAIPDDLFLGRAPRYRPTEQGYLLYSVGVNGVDDGGRGYDDEPHGDDLVVRMPLPELKRKK